MSPEHSLRFIFLHYRTDSYIHRTLILIFLFSLGLLKKLIYTLFIYLLILVLKLAFKLILTRSLPRIHTYSYPHSLSCTYSHYFSYAYCRHPSTASNSFSYSYFHANSCTYTVRWNCVGPVKLELLGSETSIGPYTFWTPH